jgi:hypothetical protein
MVKKELMDILNRKQKANLKLVEKLVGNKITYGHQLEKTAKMLFGDTFKGIYGTSDKKPRLQDGDSYIVNKPSNVHWIAKVKMGGKSYTYDSFNRKSFLGGNRNGDFDDYADQYPSQVNCGARSIAFILTVVQNPELFKALKTLKYCD